MWPSSLHTAGRSRSSIYCCHGSICSDAEIKLYSSAPPGPAGFYSCASMSEQMSQTNSFRLIYLFGVISVFSADICSSDAAVLRKIRDKQMLRIFHCNNSTWNMELRIMLLKISKADLMSVSWSLYWRRCDLFFKMGEAIYLGMSRFNAYKKKHVWFCCDNLVSTFKNPSLYDQLTSTSTRTANWLQSDSHNT